jgi:hypothetical protein
MKGVVCVQVGNYVQTTRPVMPPPLQPMPGVGQPAMPGVPGVGGIPAPRQPLGAPGARMAYPQQQSQQPSYPPVQMSDAFSASLQHQPFATNFANMSLQGSGAINLLTEKNLVSGDGVELPTPQLPPEWKKSHTNPELVLQWLSLCTAWIKCVTFVCLACSNGVVFVRVVYSGAR